MTGAMTYASPEARCLVGSSSVVGGDAVVIFLMPAWYQGGGTLAVTVAVAVTVAEAEVKMEIGANSEVVK